MKQIEVQIMGMSYLLGCPDGGEKGLRDAVGRVDQAMCQIRDGGKIKARDRIAVLAALNLAFDAATAPAPVPAPAPSPEPESNLAAAAPVSTPAPEPAPALPPVAVAAPEPAPIAPPQPTPDPTEAVTPGSSLGAADEQRLLDLVAKMDAVLAADGQLF